MANGLMKEGLAPRELMRSLGHDPGPGDRGLEDDSGPADPPRGNYDPDQPRVSAGNGRESGRWTSGGGDEGAAAEFKDDRKPIRLASSSSDISPFLAEQPSQRMLHALLLMTARVLSATRVLDWVFVPRYSPAGVIEGDVPGYPNFRYRWDGPAEHLALDVKVDDQWVTLAAGHSDSGGLFRDQSGRAFARANATGLVFEARALELPSKGGGSQDDAAAAAAITAAAAAARAAGAATATSQATTKERPKLCPDPVVESNAGWSPNSIAYQQYVTGLAPGLAVEFNGVRFDGCRESNGHLLEAKARYWQFLIPNSKGEFFFNPAEEWARTLERQSAAAGDRIVEWHVQDESVANAIRTLAEPYTNIQVIYDPWP